MPTISSPSAGLNPLLLRWGWHSDGAAQIREISQIVGLSTDSPSPSKNGNTSRSMFGPVVGRSLTDPLYFFVRGSTETRYSGVSSSNLSRSRPFLTETFHPSRSENICALLRNIASISRGNFDAREP